MPLLLPLLMLIGLSSFLVMFRNYWNQFCQSKNKFAIEPRDIWVRIAKLLIISGCKLSISHSRFYSHSGFKGFFFHRMWKTLLWPLCSQGWSAKDPQNYFLEKFPNFNANIFSTFLGFYKYSSGDIWYVHCTLSEKSKDPFKTFYDKFI